MRKYTSFEKLDRFMLHELIDRITIYETPGMVLFVSLSEPKPPVFLQIK
ncbi:DUF4368 domain-containing protein [Faecalibaculum rodentium]